MVVVLLLLLFWLVNLWRLHRWQGQLPQERYVLRPLWELALPAIGPTRLFGYAADCNAALPLAAPRPANTIIATAATAPGSAKAMKFSASGS
ncbi:hypothetical protein D3C78_1035860 [compost metagenome]